MKMLSANQYGDSVYLWFGENNLANYVITFKLLEVLPRQRSKHWGKVIKCECGMEKHGFANHAQWCDMDKRRVYI